MKITVEDFLLKVDDSFADVKLYNHVTGREMFRGSSEDAIKNYAESEVIGFGTDLYNYLCVDIEVI